jgi:hypothetical protein
MNRLARFSVLLGLILILAYPVCAEPLKGRIGSSEKWGSGWIDLDKMTDFKPGDKLKLRIGGTAEKIVVRFLAKDEDPNDPAGIDGGIIKVPESRVVQVTLEAGHEHIVQISVHGGPSPWNLYSLGGGNGPAKIVSAERVK